MKSIKRTLLGIISSLLLAAGFVRAAGDLDPINTSAIAGETRSPVSDSSPTCVNDCDIADLD